MNFAARLAAVRSGRADVDEIGGLANLALDEGEEESVLPLVVAAANRSGSARLWQWTGLLHRGLDDHAAALAAFEEAVRLAPGDASIAHGHARVAYEAGLDAVALFETAERSGPPSSDVLIGLAAARWATGRGDEAEAALDSILMQVPMWIAGHVQLAQLRALMGRAEEAYASLERALVQAPKSLPLWRALFNLHLEGENHAELAEGILRAEAAGIPGPEIADYAAICAAECGDGDRADQLFEALLGEAVCQSTRIWFVRHLLRTRRFARVGSLIDAEIEAGGARRGAIWPYADLFWRLTGDRRADWLSGNPALVRAFDLSDRLPPLAQLAEYLRSLHIARGEYLDQSVRGGTQTDGPLFCRVDPMARALRASVTEAVKAYIAALPETDPEHPLLAMRRDRRVRFAGSWSVRLHHGGFHANHVHPQGWISSALYVALPKRQPGDRADAGWFKLGEPQAALGLDMLPTQLVEPVPGRLVLFPSWLWHGTQPFSDGERLTVAFDVAPPR